jgi:Kef-type K+ transport system membrane component KefB
LVILLLSSFLALQAGDGNGLIEISIVFGKMLLFLVTSVTFGLWVLPRLTKRIASLNVSQGSVTLAIVVLLFYGIGAEIIGGMAAITGTFIAGLMYARTQQKNEIQHGLRSLAYGFFIPIFFVAIGIGIDLKELNIHALWALLLISVIAILGKILGAGLGARLGRFSWRESLQLGIGLVSRGEVGLIVAKIGLDLGYLNNEFFSTIVGMVMITTLVTPQM